MSGVQLEIDVEYLAVTRALVELAAATGKPLGQVVRQNGRLIAVNLAYQTQPLGDGDDARKLGEEAVSRDIRRVYQTPQQAYAEIKALAGAGNHAGTRTARTFLAAVYRGDMAQAHRILRSVGISRDIGKFDGGDLHQRARNSRGRVSARRPGMIVTDPKKLDSYEKKIQKRVGSAKDGWADVAKELGGTRGIPHFAKRHKRVSGTLTDRTNDPDAPHVIMHNNVPWIRQILTQRQQTEALRIQREKMIAHVLKVVNEQLRRSRLN